MPHRPVLSLKRPGAALLASIAVVTSAAISAIATEAPAFAAGGAATQLVITVPGPMTAGVPITITFFAEDAGGNVDPNFNGMVTVSGTGGSS